MEDKKLVKEIQKGHKELLRVVVEKYYKDIYCFCAYLTGEQDASYDLAQETFLKFIQYVDGYRYRNLKGYLLTIARNVCMDHFRRRKKESQMLFHAARGKAGEPGNSEEYIEKEQSAYRTEEEQSAYEQVEQRIWLAGVLQKLPLMQREAIVLFYYDDLKHKEIAEMMGCSVSTVKSRIRQGTEKLRKYCKEEGYEG